MGTLKGLDPKKLRVKVEEHIRAKALEELAGKQKHEQVVDEISEWADAQLTFGGGPIGRLAEALDGLVIKLLVGALVEETYERIKGELEKPSQ